MCKQDKVFGPTTDVLGDIHVTINPAMDVPKTVKCTVTSYECRYIGSDALGRITRGLRSLPRLRDPRDRVFTTVTCFGAVRGASCGTYTDCCCTD